MNPLLPLVTLLITLASATGPATQPIAELKPRTTIKEHTADVRAIEYSRDGRTLVSADASGVILILNGVTGKKLRQIDGAKGKGIVTMSIDLSWKTIATAHEDEVVRIWDAATGELNRQIPVPSLSSARLSPDGSLLVCTRGTIPENADNNVHILLFNPKNGMQYASIGDDFEYVFEAAFSPDGTKLAVSGGEPLTDVPPEKGGRQRCRIDLWDVKITANGSEAKLLRAIGENSPQPLRGLVFSSTGKLVAAASGDWLVWETAGGKLIATLRAPQFKAHCLTFSPSVRWVATGAIDSTVALFNTRDWETGYQGQGDASMAVGAIAFNPDGSILAAARGRLIELFAVPVR